MGRRSRGIGLLKEELYLQQHHPVFYNGAKHHRTHRGELLDFVNYPYLREIYLDQGGKDVQKSTQSGLTEWLINLAFVFARIGLQIFYVLPTIELLSRFVRNRYDKSIAHSTYYQSIVSRNGKASDAVMLKHIEDGAIAFTGSNSTVGFVEFPADVLIVDEENQCNLKNLEMATERLSASDYRWQYRVSQPSVLKYGIHARILKSSQALWHIKCDCGHWVQPDMFKHVLRQEGPNEFVIRDTAYERDSDEDINLICDKCGRPIHRYSDGEWVHTFPNKRSGLTISKLFSSKESLKEIVDRFDEGLYNSSIMQRVYNADLGLPYTQEGATVTVSSLDRCVADYFMPGRFDEAVCVLGADVGSVIHIKISSMTTDGKLRAVFIGSVKEEEDFYVVVDRFNIVCGVIDALPETRLSRRVCEKLPYMYRCYYGAGKDDRLDEDLKTVTVNRTAALDNVKESILAKKILLPKNAPDIPEYYEHMQSCTRVLREDEKEYEWVKTGPDHLFHASGYELIAKNLILRLSA